MCEEAPLVGARESLRCPAVGELGWVAFMV
jgi:hypothetical protein